MIDNLVKGLWARSKAAVNDQLSMGSGFARAPVSTDVCLLAGAAAASVAGKRWRVGRARAALAPAGAGGPPAVPHALVAGRVQEDLVATHRINALVILPFESEPLTEPVKQVRKQGVFVTVVDRGLSEPGIENLYVGGNNPQYGVVAAEYFKRKFPNGASIVVMRGIPTAIDNIRIEAFQKALAGTKIKVLDMQYANWNPDKGFQVMQDYLQRFPAIDGVWAGDDDAALGALEAIKQAGRQDKIALLGGSGMNRVVKAVMDGGSPIDADIFYPPTIIIPAIGLTVLRSTTQAPVQGRYVLDSPLITKENAGDYYFAASPY